MGKEAQAWLKSKRDYFAGLEILRTSGISDFMLDLLADGPDSFNTPALIKEIQTLASQVPADHEPVAVPVATPVVEQPSAPTPEPETEQVSATGKNLEKKLKIDLMIRDLWKEICHLHGQLIVLPEGDQLYQASNLLLLKNVKRQRLWDELHYFNTHGHWFDELPENQPKAENLEQEIKNAMSNRAKMKKYLKTPLPAFKKDYYQARVAEWTKRIDELKSQRDAK